MTTFPSSDMSTQHQKTASPSVTAVDVPSSVAIAASATPVPRAHLAAPGADPLHGDNNSASVIHGWPRHPHAGGLALPMTTTVHGQQHLRTLENQQTYLHCHRTSRGPAAIHLPRIQPSACQPQPIKPQPARNPDGISVLLPCPSNTHQTQAWQGGSASKAPTSIPTQAAAPCTQTQPWRLQLQPSVARPAPNPYSGHCQRPCLQHASNIPLGTLNVSNGSNGLHAISPPHDPRTLPSQHPHAAQPSQQACNTVPLPQNSTNHPHASFPPGTGSSRPPPACLSGGDPGASASVLNARGFTSGFPAGPFTGPANCNDGQVHNSAMQMNAPGARFDQNTVRPSNSSIEETFEAAMSGGTHLNQSERLVQTDEVLDLHAGGAPCLAQRGRMAVTARGKRSCSSNLKRIPRKKGARKNCGGALEAQFDVFGGRL
jgi:hypothetical protein